MLDFARIFNNCYYNPLCEDIRDIGGLGLPMNYIRSGLSPEKISPYHKYNSFPIMHLWNRYNTNVTVVLHNPGYFYNLRRAIGRHVSNACFMGVIKKYITINLHVLDK